MTRDEVMIAVPIRRPATTIATWVLRRKKLPTPMRSGNRFRPAQPRTARQVLVTLLILVTGTCLAVLGLAGRKRVPPRIGVGNFFRRKTHVAVVVAGPRLRDPLHSPP